MVPGNGEADSEGMVSSASPDAVCPQSVVSVIYQTRWRRALHALDCISSETDRLKGVIQRIWATVSYPSVARSSSFGKGLRVARLVIPSSSHAATLCTFARRIFFSIGDNTDVTTPWSYSRLWTISAHSPTPPFSNATQVSHPKSVMWLYQKSTSKTKTNGTWTLYEHTSDTPLSTSEQICPSYIL